MTARITTLRPLRAAALLALAAGATVGPVASAQPDEPPPTAASPAERARDMAIEDLRRENDRLRRRIAELEAQILTLTGGPNSVNAGDPASATAPIPAEATASPASLRRALMLAYDTEFEPDDRPKLGEPAGDYRREVQRWARTIGQELRGRVEWLARMELVPLDPDARPSEARRRRVVLSVLDPASLNIIDQPEIVDVPTRFVDRIENAAEDQLWVLSGHVEATPVYDATRTEAGPFDYPAFIGPYAAFGFDLRWTNLAEISPDRAREGLVSPSEQRGPVDR